VDAVGLAARRKRQHPLLPVLRQRLEEVGKLDVLEVALEGHRRFTPRDASSRRRSRAAKEQWFPGPDSSGENGVLEGGRPSGVVADDSSERSPLRWRGAFTSPAERSSQEKCRNAACFMD
jgi:hypothetical protein